MEKSTPKIVKKDDSKKSMQHHKPEIKFKNRAHMLSYIASQVARNKRSRFNMKFIVSD